MILLECKYIKYYIRIHKDIRLMAVLNILKYLDNGESDTGV